MRNLIPFSVEAETAAPSTYPKKEDRELGRSFAKFKSNDKTSIRHWKSRVKPRSFKYRGELKTCRALSVRIQHNGQEKWINLETTDKTKAAKLARDLYLDLKAFGWVAVEKMGLTVPGVSKRGNMLTVGAILTIYQTTSESDARTISGNCSALRRFLADVLGMPRLDQTANKFAAEIWRQGIDKILVRDIRAHDQESWRKRNAPGTDRRISKTGMPVSSVNSLLRAVNSIVRANPDVRAVLDKCGLSLGPFKLFPCPKNLYEELVPPQVLLDAADKELKVRKNEQYKLLLIMLGAGLRRTEADLLLWTAFDWDSGYLTIEPSSFYGLKTLSSYGKIKLQPEILSYFKNCYEAESGKSEFVLFSKRPPRRHLVAYTYYRAKQTEDDLVKWLRDKGVDRQRPLSEIRKAYGNVICEIFGVFVASRALRHSNLKTSIDNYLKGRSDGTTDFKI